MNAYEISVRAYTIQRVIYSEDGLKTYRRTVMITRSLPKARIYLEKLWKKYPDRVYELRIDQDEITLFDYLETLSDLTIQLNEVLENDF